MKVEYISATLEVKSSGFIIPPPLSTNKSIETLAQWFASQSKLCDSITAKITCVFRLFRTPDRNYAIYLAFTKRLETGNQPFEYISNIGSSFQLPAETRSLTHDQVVDKVAAEYHAFSQADKDKARVFERAESVNVTLDNYYIIKLSGQ